MRMHMGFTAHLDSTHRIYLCGDYATLHINDVEMFQGSIDDLGAPYPDVIQKLIQLNFIKWVD